MNLKKFFAALSIFTLTAVGFTGCGGEKDQDTAEILKVGTAFDVESKSFGFSDSEQGEFQGFDMDLIRAIGREIGRPVQISNINFEGLIPTLRSGNTDVIIAGLTITDERRKLISFSDPYYEAGLTAMVQADSDINTPADLAGKRIGVKIESTSSEFAKTIPNAEIHEYDLANDTFTALENQEVDAVINDRPLNDHAIAVNQVTNARILSDMLTEEDYGIAVRKDDVKLLQAINETLKKLHDTGEYKQIYSKWFESENVEKTGGNQPPSSYRSLREEIAE